MAAKHTKSKGKKQRAPIPVRAARDAGDICALCGMCCDGTLFIAANLERGEEEHAAALGLRLGVNPAGEPVFEQPCPAFVDGCCSVYAQRPQVCRDYRCALLPAYESGRMSKDDCIDVIESMRTVIRTAEEQMDMEMGTFSSRAIDERLKRQRPQDHVAENQPLLVTLDRFRHLAKEFFGRRPLSAEVEAAAEKAASPVETG